MDCVCNVCMLTIVRSKTYYRHCLTTIRILPLDTANTWGPLPKAISMIFFLHNTSTFLGSKLLCESPAMKNYINSAKMYATYIVLQ